MSEAAVHLLDHGYIRLVERWGSDERIVEAARMSTDKGFLGWGPIICTKCEGTSLEGDDGGKGDDEPCSKCGGSGRCSGDEKLLKYLYTHKHFTPFEMGGLIVEVQAPIFVFREWHRHRTQCLAAGTQVIFSNPFNGAAYPFSIERLAANFAIPHERKRIEDMNLRYRTSAGDVRHTKVLDAFASGEKRVYRIVTDSGEVLASSDHRFLTTGGWRTVGELSSCDVFFTRQAGNAIESLPPVFTPEELASETWKEIIDGYDVSDLGRVRSWWAPGQKAFRTKKSAPVLKTVTVNNVGRAVVGLPNGKSKTQAVQVSHLVFEAFEGSRNGLHVLHKDDNPQNNRRTNLVAGDDALNSGHRVRHGSQTRLRALPERIRFIQDAGTALTYDIEVEAPEHNFVANGFITHNSYNEMSGRYVELPKLSYIPSDARIAIARQGKTNKQGSESFSEETLTQVQNIVRVAFADNYEQSWAHYQEMLSHGVARELAARVLPTSQYSRMRASANLRNWLAFLTLRMDTAAQYEIRMYANEVANLIRAAFPRTYELFAEGKS